MPWLTGTAGGTARRPEAFADCERLPEIPSLPVAQGHAIAQQHKAHCVSSIVAKPERPLIAMLGTRSVESSKTLLARDAEPLRPYQILAILSNRLFLHRPQGLPPLPGGTVLSSASMRLAAKNDLGSP